MERAVTAQRLRVSRLERTAGPERALEEHRAVLSMLVTADAANTGAAAHLRREIARLELPNAA
jgi:hypothetical protein